MRNNDQLNVPQSGALSGDANGAKFEIRTIFIALRCWWKFALPAGLLLAAAAGSWVYYSFEPTYAAKVMIEIKEQPTKILDAPTERSGRFVANQIQLMKSSYLLARLLSIPEIKSLPEIEQASDKVGALAGRLRVARQGDSDWYTIEFTSKSAQHAADIVNAVVSEYLKEFYRYEQARRDELLKILVAMKEKQEASVDAAKQSFDTEATLAGFKLNDQVLGAAVIKPQTPEEVELARVQTSLRESDNVVTNLEVELAVAERGQGANNPALTAFVERALQDELEGIKQQIASVEALKRPYDDTATKTQLANNLKYQKLVTTLAGLESSLLPERLQARRTEIADELAQSFEQAFQASVQDIKARLATAKELQRTLQSRYDEALKKLPQSRASSAQLRFAMDTYQREYSIHSSLEDMLKAIDTNAQFEGDRVTIKSEAEVPRTPLEVLPIKKVGMYAGAAFCIPFLLTVAWEHFFRRVNSRQQLESAGAMKVVGEITTLPRRTPRRVKGKVSRDLQLFEESVDGLRTYLSLLDTLQGLRVLAVTSAVSREGKTVVAAQLAMSIAGATGEPTLLIDGDLRSPDVHHVFGVDLAPGLTDVLSGDLADDEAIETNFNETLHLMTAGKLASSPHRLLGSGKFEALLERLRGIYRYIVIDTPPLLPASESLILARSADAVILAARRDFSRLDQVTEAYTRLRAAGASFAGVVLNGIPTRHYAYKYGSYGYNERMAAPE